MDCVPIINTCSQLSLVYEKNNKFMHFMKIYCVNCKDVANDTAMYININC